MTLKRTLLIDASETLSSRNRAKKMWTALAYAVGRVETAARVLDGGAVFARPKP
jgi:hypothetical protein